MPTGYYSIQSKDFSKFSRFKFKVVDTLGDLHTEFANSFLNLIKSNNARGKRTYVILPVGPFDYKKVAQLFNNEGVHCGSLTIFMMDEYCTEDGQTIPYEHPLSFHRFMDENLFCLLRKDSTIPRENIVFPEPNTPDLVTKKIEELGGVDVCFAGFGINGHIAFNEPVKSRNKIDEKSIINSVTRIVDLSCETRTALAMGSTCGNWNLVPSKAITIGMKEILMSREIRLYFMRTWHAGIMRRALFGPVSPCFPASHVQTHPNVTVTMTSYVAELPMINVTQSVGR